MVTQCVSSGDSEPAIEEDLPRSCMLAACNRPSIPIIAPAEVPCELDSLIVFVAHKLVRYDTNSCNAPEVRYPQTCRAASNPTKHCAEIVAAA